jgi:hypothetical protein
MVNEHGTERDKKGNIRGLLNVLSQNVSERG